MVVGTRTSASPQLRDYFDARVDYVVFDSTFHGIESADVIADR